MNYLFFKNLLDVRKTAAATKFYYQSSSAVQSSITLLFDDYYVHRVCFIIEYSTDLSILDEKNGNYPNNES